MEESARLVPDWLIVSRETLAKLEAFLDLVVKWNSKVNLVSRSSLGQAWQRHILDSAQLWGIAKVERGVWLDVGSGAGFPGIVIAILAQQHSADLTVALVESDRRKSVFLREAVRQLGLTAKVYCERIEVLPKVGAQIVSARALAPLSELLPMVHRHQDDGCVSLFPKGQSHAMELYSCRAQWTMQTEVVQSKTDPSGALLLIRDLNRA